MWTSLWLLVTLAAPSLGTYRSIKCPLGEQCQQALLSHHDVLLRCNFSREVQWSHCPLRHVFPGFNVTLFPNMERTPEGHLLIRSPQPSQSGTYVCSHPSSDFTIIYEIDFQDVGALYVSHRSLNQAPLNEERLSPGRGGALVFTRWEAWQDCSLCGRTAERRRLGFCYVYDPDQGAAPCGIYLGAAASQWVRRMRPEMQVEACYARCSQASEPRLGLVVFSNFKFDDKTESVWLTCPLGSIYRPIIWEADGVPLTWKGQLSGEDVSTVLDPSSGGQRLQVFQPATYKCFVQQELVARFNPKADIGKLESPWKVGARSRLQPHRDKADSVLQGLKLMLLVGLALGLLGGLFKLLRPARRGKRGDQVLLVK